MVVSDKTKGIFWMLVSVLGFTFMGIAVKYLPRIPTYEKVFFRNSVSFITSVYILYRKKETKDWHFLCHLDPGFLDIEDLDGYVKEILEDL